MAICTKCKNTVPDDVTFCPACGAPMNTHSTGNYQNTFMKWFYRFTDTSDTTAEYDPGDIQYNMIMAVLSYISWLVIIPLIAAKNSPFARFHANQGLVLAIAEIIWGIAARITAASLFAAGLGLIAGIIALLSRLVNLLFVVMSVIGVINAVSGKAKELPIIGKIRILK